MELTKDMLGLVDALLERVRSEVLSNINLGAETTGSIDISGDTDIEDKIQEHLRPAIEAVTFALKIAQFARLDTDAFLWDDLLYFLDENAEVRMASFSEIQRAWRPLPPGPVYKIEFAPPEDISIPKIEGGEGPIQ